MSKKKTKKHETNGHADTTPAPATTPASLPAGATEKRRYTEELDVKNTDAQQAVMAGQLADVILEKGRIEDEKKEAMGGFNEKLKDLEAREKELAKDVHGGTHKEPVEVVEFLLPDNRIMCVRSDTSEIVEERVADADDLQEPMFDEDSVPGTEHRDTPGEDEAAELSEDQQGAARDREAETRRAIEGR